MPQLGDEVRLTAVVDDPPVVLDFSRRRLSSGASGERRRVSSGMRY
jgi:hypothetical protein